MWPAIVVGGAAGGVLLVQLFGSEPDEQQMKSVGQPPAVVLPQRQAQQPVAREPLISALEQAEVDQQAELERANSESAALVKLRSELEKKRGSEQNVRLLLSKAEQRYRRKRYLKPSDDNAFDLYQQVLRVDHDNRQALDGLANIQRYYRQRFYQQLKKGHLKSAQLSVNAIAKISPNSTLWRRVRKNLLRAKAAVKVAPKVKVSRQSEIEIVSGLLAEFKRAFESQNRSSLEKISEISASRRGFIKQLFTQYRSLRLKISNFQHINKKHQGSANIQISDLISRAGESVQPGSWARFDIRIEKNRAGVWKVFW